MSWENGLTRRQARTLRRLAQVYLTHLEAKLKTLSITTPPKPGQRVRPYVLCLWAIEDIKVAIRKLRRIETT
jgi:hypothetical protein